MSSYLCFVATRCPWRLQPWSTTASYALLFRYRHALRLQLRLTLRVRIARHVPQILSVRELCVRPSLVPRTLQFEHCACDETLQFSRFVRWNRCRGFAVSRRHHHLVFSRTVFARPLGMAKPHHVHHPAMKSLITLPFCFVFLPSISTPMSPSAPCRRA